MTIFQPILFKSSSQETRLCELVQFCESDLPAILSFQESVCSKMENQSFCVSLSLQEWQYLLHHGFIEGLVFEGEISYLVACLYPSLEENLGQELGLAAEELAQVAHLEIGLTAANFRGFGMHSWMLSHCVEHLRLDGRTRIICSTVAPENLPSLRALEKAGLHIALEKEMYGGKRRYIMSNRFENLG